MIRSENPEAIRIEEIRREAVYVIKAVSEKNSLEDNYDDLPFPFALSGPEVLEENWIWTIISREKFHI